MTDHYNNTMAGGKWRHSMTMNPRDLPVFAPPTLPVPADSLGNYDTDTWPTETAAPLETVTDGSFVAANACCYESASDSAYRVEMLGHSMNALALPKNASVTYRFTTACEGDAALRMALIPTQPTDAGDLRFKVSIDGGEPMTCSLKEKFRSEGWKRNVLRGQAVKTFNVHLDKGVHTLTVTALDHHIVLDQWMIDFIPDRQFYVFPTTCCDSHPSHHCAIRRSGDPVCRSTPQTH